MPAAKNLETLNALTAEIESFAARYHADEEMFWGVVAGIIDHAAHVACCADGVSRSNVNLNERRTELYNYADSELFGARLRARLAA